jgi:hypothetical protein
LICFLVRRIRAWIESPHSLDPGDQPVCQPWRLATVTLRDIRWCALRPRGPSSASVSLRGVQRSVGLPRSIVDILRTFRPGRRPEGLSLVSGSHESEVIMGFSGCMVCHQRTVCVHSVDPVLLVRSGGAEMISMRRPTLQSLGRRMTRQTDRRNHFLFGCCLETAARAIRSIERPCTADAIPWCFLPKQETGDAPLQPHLARMPMIVTG